MAQVDNVNIEWQRMLNVRTLKLSDSAHAQDETVEKQFGGNFTYKAKKTSSICFLHLSNNV